MMEDIETQYNKAESVANGPNGAAAALPLLTKIVHETDVDADDIDGIRYKELAILKMSEIYRGQKNSKALVELLLSIRSFFGIIPKAKTTKIVRQLFDQIFHSGAPADAQIQVCEEMIKWSRQEKQTFLRHRLQHRLAQVYYQEREANKAMSVLTPLLREVRRLEDKALLVDVHLLESKVQYSIKNRTKARAALIAGRTNANAIYCPPLQQAEIDMQSGILHADEKDNKTAFSYLYEAFEGYHGLGDHAGEARRALKYMILSKILADDSGDELRAVLSAKNVLEYTGPDIESLHAVADAYKAKDTHAFNEARKKYKQDLEDEIASVHLDSMYDQLLESHLLKVIEPYNRVEITFLADTLKLESTMIEARLSQMILDKKLRGIVDQQHMCLVVFEEEHPTQLYSEALKTLETLDKLVSTLFDKVGGKYDAIIKAEEAEKQKIEEKKKENKEKEAAEADKKKG